MDAARGAGTKGISMAEQKAHRDGQPPARDLAAEAEVRATGRQTFLRHVFTRLPLVSAFVITINLFVQVRGDVGLAVAIAQNLTFGAIAVIVLLNLVVYIMVGVMVALMPMVFDPDFNRWVRIVGGLVLVLFSTVLVYTASWLLLVALALVLLTIGVVVRHARRKNPLPEMDRDSIRAELETPAAPVDTELRDLWIEGRSLLRAIDAPGPPLTAAETAAGPELEPRTFAEIVGEWNARSTLIRGYRSNSLTRVAFTGIIGFVALFGIMVLTQPIRFAPLEVVSISNAAPERGFVLLNGGRGLFVPDPFGTVQFINASDISSVQLCEDTPHWWSYSVIDVVAPGATSGVDCTDY